MGKDEGGSKICRGETDRDCLIFICSSNVSESRR